MGHAGSNILSFQWFWKLVENEDDPRALWNEPPLSIITIKIWQPSQVAPRKHHGVVYLLRVTHWGSSPVSREYVTWRVSCDPTSGLLEAQNTGLEMVRKLSLKTTKTEQFAWIDLGLRNDYFLLFPRTCPVSPTPLDGCTCLGGTTWPSGTTEFGQYMSFKGSIWRLFQNSGGLLQFRSQHYHIS